MGLAKVMGKIKIPQQNPAGRQNNCGLIKTPKTINVFGAQTAKHAQIGHKPSFIRTLTVGCGISPHHTLFIAFVGFTTDREFHPAPKVTIFN